MSDSGNSTRGTKGTRGQVGSVAQETARLLDALCATTAALTEPAPEAAPETEPEVAPEPEPAEALESCPTCGHRGEATHTGAGSLTGSAAEVCHLCPICQLLRVVKAVRPETLDRLAELAGAVTEALRDAAAARWDDTRGSAPPSPRTSRTPPTTVEDIPVGEAEDLGSWDEEAP